METTLFYLVYTSRAKKLLKDAELIALLEQSRTNNNLLGLTGMLLYMETNFIEGFEGRFIQLLEGNETNVRLIYDRILRDERNQGVLLLRSGETQSRSFPGWTMGFKSGRASNHESIPGFFELDETLLTEDGVNNAIHSLTLLKSFYEINSNFDF